MDSGAAWGGGAGRSSLHGPASVSSAVSTAVISLIKQKTVLGKLEVDPPHSKILRIFMLVVKLTCARRRRVSRSCVLWGTHFRLHSLRICSSSNKGRRAGGDPRRSGTGLPLHPLTDPARMAWPTGKSENELPSKSCFENRVFKILSLVSLQKHVI